MPLATLFHLTRIHAEVAGDTFLTGFNESEWRELSRNDYSRDAENPFDYSIRLLRRGRSAKADSPLRGPID